jgi:hypothetical protein
VASIDRKIAFELGCVVALGLLILHRGHFNSTDELGLYFQTRAMLEERSLEVPEGLLMAERGRGGASFSHYTIGQSLLALPFYAAGRVAEPFLSDDAKRMLSGTTGRKAWGGGPAVGFGAFPVLLYPAVVTGALAALFFLFERRLGASRGTSLAVSVAAATCTHVALMSTYFLQHTTEALAALGAFYFWHRFRQSGAPRDALIGSVFASAILNVRAPGAISGLALGGYLGFVLLERIRRGGDRRWLGPVALSVLLPLLGSVALYVFANQLKWGDWFESPTMLAERSRFSADLQPALTGFLVSPGMSVFVYSPLLLLVPATFVRFSREHRAEAWTLVALFATNLVFYSSYRLWTGLYSCPGPRYLFTALVFLLLPLGPWLDRGRGGLRRTAFVALAGAGALVQITSTTVSWGNLVVGEGYRGWRPRFAFLWDAQTAPLAAAWRKLGDPAYLDVWLGRVAIGWQGQPAEPGLALAVLLFWGGVLGWLVLRLHQTLRAAPMETRA